MHWRGGVMVHQGGVIGHQQKAQHSQLVSSGVLARACQTGPLALTHPQPHPPLVSPGLQTARNRGGLVLISFSQWGYSKAN